MAVAFIAKLISDAQFWMDACFLIPSGFCGLIILKSMPMTGVNYIIISPD